MVGTPTFLVLYGSMEASRWVSVIFLRFNILMNQLPNHTATTNERMTAMAARKVT